MEIQEQIEMLCVECEALKHQRMLLNRWIAINVIFGALNGIGALIGWFWR